MILETVVSSNQGIVYLSLLIIFGIVWGAVVPKLPVTMASIDVIGKWLMVSFAQGASTYFLGEGQAFPVFS